MSTQIKERQILFSAPMVRAILDGRKTQTRRIMKPQPDGFIRGAIGTFSVPKKITTKQPAPNRSIWQDEDGTCYEDILCPHGYPDDRLWVRESFYAFGRWETRYNPKKGRDEWHFVDMTPDFGPYRYEDNPPHQTESYRHKNSGFWKRPSLFMPRAASRLLLEITGIQVERLQEISEEDAKAEGVESFRPVPGDGPAVTVWKNYVTGKFNLYTARESFFTLWQSINGTESLRQNPFVWAITFKRIEP